jgi:hypothetical protein
MKALLAVIISTVALGLLCIVAYVASDSTSDSLRAASDQAPEGDEEDFCLGTKIKCDTRVADLPRHIPTHDGEFSIFADFERPSEYGFPVYLINLSNKSVKLPTGGVAGVEVMLQFCDGQDKWRRAQPQAYSDCGNSYGMVIIPPGMFFEAHGYQPKQGTKAMVRYRLYDQRNEAVSNMGEGLVNEEDIRLAGKDAMSVAEWPLDQIERVALGEETIVNESDHNDLRYIAIMQLATDRFTPAKREDILKRLHAQKDPTYSLYANQVKVEVEINRAWRSSSR